MKNIEILNKILTIAKKNKTKISNKNKIQFVVDRPGHDKRYAINSNKIRREIKWKNKTSISSGLLQTFIWYSKNLNFFKKISRRNITKRFGLKV